MERQIILKIAVGLVLFLIALLSKSVEGIGCFVCTSINGSNPACEDTFNNSMTLDVYKPNCKAGRKARTGLFPATDCIKLKAVIDDSKVEHLIRACVTDDGGINSETEIGRISHCGFIRQIKLDGKEATGCILTCNTDGCNGAVHLSLPTFGLLLTMFVLLRQLKIIHL
ncbi:unnamed protein product [Owenia fusiformis]|uniref:Uncharacterized protein n=1 Tax=Owenia fusiformis TaxID=6347 RepID=A0A8J1XFI6_OWEFU|nr:unnamed protein product [Owenia fusiformis]